MLKTVDGGEATVGTYITFEDEGRIKGGVTKTWGVKAHYEGILIGRIAWFSRWRKYCFFPFMDTVYEQTCLREIAEFIELMSKERSKERSKEHKGE